MDATQASAGGAAPLNPWRYGNRVRYATPHGTEEETFVCDCLDGWVRTTFGTFRLRDGAWLWIVDPRFRLILT